MSPDPKPPAEPGTSEDLGLTDHDTPSTHESDDESVEEDGEPFDGNFA